jgi:hypothetical protein
MKKTLITLFLLISFLNTISCGLYRPTDAKEFPPQPELRIKKNIEEGRGFRVLGGKDKSGSFEFANSNPLWRASLDTINFMPLLSVDYGGGLIITDWYSSEEDEDSIKLSIQFLSNEIRSDAIQIRVFKKKCLSLENCKIISSDSEINSQLKLAILKKAALYEKNYNKKNAKKYPLRENK